ncbi:MAG: hypothetical protein ACK46X_21240 [Candidatus Sericytochromatia bacterium]
MIPVRWLLMGTLLGTNTGCYVQMEGGGGGGGTPEPSPTPSPFYGPSPDSTFPNNQ